MKFGDANKIPLVILTVYWEREKIHTAKYVIMQVSQCFQFFEWAVKTQSGPRDGSLDYMWRNWIKKTEVLDIPHRE